MAMQIDSCCENKKEEENSLLKTWLESINFGYLFETLNQNDVWSDLSMIKEIDTEDKSLDGLIDDLNKSNIELGKPQILKLRVEIKKLKSKSKHSEEKESMLMVLENSKNEEKENELEKENDKQMKDTPYNTRDNMLNQSFECDQCNKKLSQCHLYYCVLCNGKSSQDGQNRKYYCKRHLLRYHKENHDQECKDHCHSAIEAIDNNNFDGNSIIQTLTFDIEMLEKKKEMAMQDTEKQLTKYLNDLTQKRFDFAHKLSITTGVMLPALEAGMMSVGGLGSNDVTEFMANRPAWLKNIDGATFQLAKWGYIGTSVFELAHGYWMWHRNEIESPELIGRTVMTLAKCPALLGSAYVGGVKTFHLLSKYTKGNRGVGMVAFVATVAGTGIALHGCCKLFEYLKDTFFSKGDDFEKRKQINEAFSFFQMVKDSERDAFVDKNNVEQNKQKLDRLYRGYAKMHHPDRNGGSQEKFIELTIYYATLKAVLNCRLSQKEIKDFVNNTLKAMIHS